MTAAIRSHKRVEDSPTTASCMGCTKPAARRAAIPWRDAHSCNDLSLDGVQVCLRLGDRDAGFESPQGEPVAVVSVPFHLFACREPPEKNMRGRARPPTGCFGAECSQRVAVRKWKPAGKMPITSRGISSRRTFLPITPDRHETDFARVGKSGCDIIVAFHAIFGNERAAKDWLHLKISNKFGRQATAQVKRGCSASSVSPLACGAGRSDR